MCNEDKFVFLISGKPLSMAIKYYAAIVNLLFMKLNVPNQLTIIRILLTPLFVILIISENTSYQRIAGIIFLIASLTDWYDGYFARRFHLTSRWGQFMDPLADKVLVSSALLVFAYLNLAFWWMVLIIIIRDFLVTFLRSFAMYIGKPIITSFIAKWKTFLQMAYIFLILIYINIPSLPELRIEQLNRPYLAWSNILLLLLVIMTTISGIHYVVVNRSHLFELFRRLINLLNRT
ncbi:MAG: CDP-diacylglycerol--glycerol-3-phosphate 3-phosphatidyltransferase [Caldithrix sp.]|nr:CDP-diacylglycerol--glycerol-3-phosphate 3-phosphatidyltransferase [Caldithrix sp.]